MKKAIKISTQMIIILSIFLLAISCSTLAASVTFSDDDTGSSKTYSTDNLYNRVNGGATSDNALGGMMPTDETRGEVYNTLGAHNTTTTLSVGNNEIISGETKSKLVNLKKDELSSLKDYQEAYGGATYGFVAFILNKIRVFSIPFCILGIAISSIYQYVVGHRQLEYRDKGFSAMASMVTILVICQVLPLVFAIVVKGWRG